MPGQVPAARYLAGPKWAVQETLLTPPKIGSPSLGLGAWDYRCRKLAQGPGASYGEGAKRSVALAGLHCSSFIILLLVLVLLLRILLPLLPLLLLLIIIMIIIIRSCGLDRPHQSDRKSTKLVFCPIPHPTHNVTLEVGTRTNVRGLFGRAIG